MQIFTRSLLSKLVCRTPGESTSRKSGEIFKTFDRNYVTMGDAMRKILCVRCPGLAPVTYVAVPPGISVGCGSISRAICLEGFSEFSSSLPVFIG